MCCLSVATRVTTASARRPPSRACSRRITGQVATTMAADQIAGPMNGRSTQKAARISPAMNNTAKVLRARSARGSVMRCAPGRQTR